MTPGSERLAVAITCRIRPQWVCCGIALIAVLSSAPGGAWCQGAAAEPAMPSLVEADGGGARPVIRRGGVLMFPYGQGRPELQCAPLRTCKILLSADETLLARAAGDSQRWDIAPMAGPGGATIIVVKPLACEISTDLTLTTDRRIYDMLLWAPGCGSVEFDQNPRLPYTPLVGFYHPGSVVDHASSPAGQVSSQTAEVGISLAARDGDLSALDFDYRWQRDRGFPWLPLQVFDDGARMHIRLPAEAARHDLPVLFELRADGSMRIVNYIVAGRLQDVYVVDRVLGRAVLVIGGTRGEGSLRLLISKSAVRTR